MKLVREPIEFDWDEGNKGKNKKHRVEDREAEEAFLDERKIIYKDVFHSTQERRWILLGKTRKHRPLYIVFTMRKTKIRVISARDTNRKEVPIYEKTVKDSEI